MMCLVPVAQPLEDLHRLGHARLAHHDGLEPSLECRVLLNVLPILIERRRADRLEGATCKRWLDDARGVDRPLGSPCPHERVHLVHKQDDIATLGDLFHNLLQPILELTTILRSGNECGKVEGVELLVLDRLRDLISHDRLSETFGDSRLADSGLTNQHRVVLGAAGKDLHHPLDLARPPDDRVELSVLGGTRQVSPELVEHRPAGTPPTLVSGLARLAVVAREELDDGRTDLVEIGSEIQQHLSSDPFSFADEAKEDVLGTDVVVAELKRFAKTELEHLLRPWGERYVTGGNESAPADELFDLSVYVFERDGETFKRLGCDTILLADQTE